MTSISKTKKSHSAPGQMLGYIYQLERALFWLSSSSNSDSIVCIETDDDVVARLNNGESIMTIFEQDKSSLSKGNPYSNKSKNLWKTLNIWLELISNKPIDLPNSKFIMATNAKVSTSCIAKQLDSCNSEKESEIALEKLKEIGKSPSKDVKPFVDQVLSYPDDLIKKLFHSISVSDNDYNNNRNDLKNTIRSNLGIASDMPFNEIYRNIFGWITDLTIEKWINGKIAEFSKEELLVQSNNLIAQYRGKRFIEKTVDSLPISENQIRLHKGSYFVKQVEKISLSDEEMIDCINDFLRSSMERTRYAEEGYLTHREFEDFDYRLGERWKNIFNRKLRISNASNEEEKGYDIYTETMNFRGLLGGIQTIQYYTTRGAYHRLSDQKKLGWHPKWKK